MPYTPDDKPWLDYLDTAELYDDDSVPPKKHNWRIVYLSLLCAAIVIGSTAVGYWLINTLYPE